MPEATESTALLKGDDVVAAGYKKKQIFFLVGWILFSIAWICGGIAAGMIFEGWSALTSFYVIVQIVTTIGYGDVTVHTEQGKLFMALYVLVTLVLIASFVTDALATLVSKNEDFLRKRLRVIEAKVNSHIEDEAAARAAYGWHNDLLVSVGLFAGYVAFGTVFFWWYEDCSCSYGVSAIEECVEHKCEETGGATKTIIDAFYMSVITLTTVGFGDHTPRSWYGRLIGCFWMLFGVVATGNMISKVSAVFDMHSKEDKRLKSMSREIFARIDNNKDGFLSLMEFRSFALVKFGIITEEELVEVDQIFKAIDQDGSGHLTYEEIMEYCDN